MIRRSRVKAAAGYREAGFSLLEILIATSLFAMLALLLMGALGLGTRVLAAGSQHADRASRLAAGYGFLRGQLAAAQPLPRDPARAGKGPLAFDGSPGEIDFIGLTPDYLAVGGYQALSLRREDGGGAGRLVAAWRPYRLEGGGAGESRPRESVLFEGVAAVDFAYYGAADAKSAPAWHSEWHDRDALPSLVRMRLAFQDGRVAPDLVVALRLSDGVL
jgi:general secretion pathway protein J